MLRQQPGGNWSTGLLTSLTCVKCSFTYSGKFLNIIDGLVTCLCLDLFKQVQKVLPGTVINLGLIGFGKSNISDVFLAYSLMIQY